MTVSTLIVIDAQQGFSDPVWGLRNNPDFEKNVALVLEHWRRRRWPVIHVRHDSVLPESPLRPGRSGNDFMDCSYPLLGETVIGKTVNSAFIGTNLAAKLFEMDSKNLVLCGLTSDHCVSSTTRMAANLEFQCTIVEDGTATFGRVNSKGEKFAADLVHEVSMASLAGEFARMVTTRELQFL